MPTTRSGRSRGFPPALTKAELRALFERCPTPEVKRLLWEIARLQALAQRAQDVADMLSPTQLDQLLVIEIPLETAIAPYLHALRTALKREACVLAGRIDYPGPASDFGPQPERALSAGEARREAAREARRLRGG